MKLPLGASRETWIRFIIVAWALPAVMSYFVYFAFANFYSGNVFHPEGFSAIYDNGIFKYRVLGINLLRMTHELIVLLGLPTSIPSGLQALYPESSPEWYSAFFYLNVATLGLTMSVYFVIMNKLSKPGYAFFTDLALLLLLGLMTFSQYVIVPYDMLSYFFQACAIYLIMFRADKLETLFYLCAIIVLGALTRETAALILSFYAAVNFKDIVRFPPRLFETDSRRPSPFLWLAILTLSFLGAYAALRLSIHTDQPFYKAVRFKYNMASQISVFGFIYFIVACIALLIPQSARKAMVLFLITSAPYTVMILLVSSPREIRIWAPMFMPMIVLLFQAEMAKLSNQKA